MFTRYHLAGTAAVCLSGCISLTAFASEIYKLGDCGEAVAQIQSRLNELGYNDAETDGVFGEGTQKAVETFQYENSLLVTGMVDEVTWTILMSEEAERAPEPGSEAGYNIFDLLDGAAKNVTAESECMYMYEMDVMEEPMMLSGAAAEYDVQWNTKEYTTFAENGFQSVAAAPLSTFAADVDTASWSQIRQMILNGEEVSADAVRVEEMLNYFHYQYKTPEGDEPFGVTMELGDCPWNKETKLLLIGLQAKEIEKADQQSRNFVFLIDVSGSMDEPEKLPLVKRSFQLLLDELNPTDTVSIVTYASYDEVLLEGVPAANKTQIMEAINDLMAGGSTNGSAGITTAYEIAEKYYIDGGVNRIILATDGDLNVGTTSEGDLARLVLEKKENGVSLTALGFGGYNFKDNKMEALADYGDGNYWYIDTIYEARKALVTEGGGTFNTVAKDVKLQVDFNPEMIRGYRLIGYEDRLLAAEDFADDSVDGGEIGSGHRVTALYEIVPADSDFDFGEVQSKYTKQSQSETEKTDEGIADTESTGEEDINEDRKADNNTYSKENHTGDIKGEWLTLSVRAKEPDGDTSKLYEYVLDENTEVTATDNLSFAAAVTEVGMLLRDSRFKGSSSYDDALELLRSCDNVSGDVYKEELVYLTGLLQRQG